MVRKRFMTGALMVVAALTFACANSDPGITTAVKSKLAADDTVKAYRIDVDTEDRVVTLTGNVDTSVARQRAVEIARTTDGVNNVIDNLTVAPGATPTTGIDDPVQDKAADAGEAAKDKARRADDATDSAQRRAGDTADRAGDVIEDAAITSAVKTKLLGDPDVGGLKIDVDTAGGVVTLTGTVENAAEKRQALELARETRGVKSVKDQLKIGRR